MTPFTDSWEAEINRLITSFVETTPGVAHAVVVAEDGLLLGFSDPLSHDTADQAAAIVGVLQSVAQGAARFFHGGPVTQTLVDMADGRLLLMTISDGLSLGVFATPDADVGSAVEATAGFVERAGRMLIPGVADG
ncbi:roadblock/LC7 domain-containing protein [Actinocrispum wychmicini]|uniref:Roadblock/LAMTOR2 domain-containing protein n=1 Tax=Actinocrispum wychmicini TaxID=1213861 RepID=A0A4R2JTM0_9PSEU|nr:roadblock/LC7 domain-containing protein [Actinocrispum wychmicini]TCO60628.1 hypothetical protein EV192_103203 [Actinocrispum wychmicini]